MKIISKGWIQVEKSRNYVYKFSSHSCYILSQMNLYIQFLSLIIIAFLAFFNPSIPILMNRSNNFKREQITRREPTFSSQTPITETPSVSNNTAKSESSNSEQSRWYQDSMPKFKRVGKKQANAEKKDHKYQQPKGKYQKETYQFQHPHKHQKQCSPRSPQTKHLPNDGQTQYRHQPNRRMYQQKFRGNYSGRDVNYKLMNAQIAVSWIKKLKSIRIPDQCEAVLEKGLVECLLEVSSKIKRKHNFKGTAYIENLILRTGKYEIHHIYDSKRITNGKNQRYFIFFPSITTCQIFRKMRKSCNLSGCYGTSKTSSVIFYIQLNNFIIDYLMGVNYHARSIFYKMNDVQYVYKHFFISFSSQWKQKQIIKNACSILRAQTRNQIVLKNAQEIETITTLTELVEQIKQKYKDKGILIIINIDQFNIIASLISQTLNLYKLLQPPQEQIAEMKKIILVYKDLYIRLQLKFNQTIVTSSINVQGNLFKTYYLIDKRFTLGKQENFNCEQIPYLQFERKAWSIKEKYCWLMFEVSKCIKIQKTYALDQELVEFYQKIFLEFFQIDGNSIQKIQQNLLSHDWIAKEKPININQNAKGLTKNFNQINDQSTESQQLFKKLLSSIRQNAPDEKSKIILRQFEKLQGSEFINAFYTCVSFIHQAQKIVERNPTIDQMDLLKKDGKFEVTYESDMEYYINKEYVEFLVTNPNKPLTAIIYMDPLEFMKTIHFVNRQIMKQYQEIILSKRLRTPEQLTKQGSGHTHGPELDQLFGKLIRQQKWKTQLNQVYFLDEKSITKKAFCKLEYIIEAKCEFQQFNRKNNQHTKKFPVELQDARKNMKKIFDLAMEQEGKCISGVPSINENYSSSSKSFDGAIVLYHKQRNIIEVLTIDVTMSTSSVNEYKAKINNAKSLLDNIGMKQAKQAEKNQENRPSLYFYHIIIGQKSLIQEYVGKNTCASAGQRWNIGLCAIDDWIFKAQKLELMYDQVRLKKIAKDLDNEYNQKNQKQINNKPKRTDKKMKNIVQNNSIS